MKQWIEIWHTQKEREGLLYDKGAGKMIVFSKVMHGECE